MSESKIKYSLRRLRRFCREIYWRCVLLNSGLSKTEVDELIAASRAALTMIGVTQKPALEYFHSLSIAGVPTKKLPILVALAKLHFDEGKTGSMEEAIEEVKYIIEES